jgi:hypothetical protein
MKFKYNIDRAIHQRFVFSLQWSGISPRLFHMTFMLDRVTLGQTSLRELRFSLPTVIPPMIHIHPSSRANTIGPTEGTLLRDLLSPRYN